MSLLPYLPKPLLEDFLRGRWVPIVGAGFSRNARLSQGQMPDWQTLADALAKDLIEYEPQNAVDAISAWSEQFGRARLIERLGELLHVTKAQPGDAHLALCSAGFDLLLTTNFDYLIEQGYQQIQRPCQPLLAEAQLSQRPADGQAQLLKLHGDLNHPDQLVATEDDFDGFLERNPLLATFTANLLITRTPVFLGYSFDDPDTRSIWALIRDRLGSLRRQGYAIKVDASLTEVARFERRGVHVVNLPAGDYGETFARLFRELHDEYVKQAPKVSAATEDQVAAELSLPPGYSRRLCFCSVPVDLLPWYRAEVFPEIESAGYVTVTRDEVLTSGSNTATDLDALLSRAQVALIDSDGHFGGGYELARAASILGPSRVLVVGQSVWPAFLDSSLTSLHRDETTLDNPEDFAAKVKDWLRRDNAPSRRTQELTELGLLGPALVMALGDLEITLLAVLDIPATERPPSLTQLVGMAIEREHLSDAEGADLRRWITTRNRVAHGRPVDDLTFVPQALEKLESLISRLKPGAPR